MAMKTSFIGTWQLLEENYESTTDNESINILGDNPYGLLIYTQEGYMSVFLSS